MIELMLLITLFVVASFVYFVATMVYAVSVGLTNLEKHIQKRAKIAKAAKQAQDYKDFMEAWGRHWHGK